MTDNLDHPEGDFTEDDALAAIEREQRESSFEDDDFVAPKLGVDFVAPWFVFTEDEP